VTTIRPATLDDVPAMVTMGRRFLSTVYAGRLADHPAQLAALATQLIGHADSLVLVAEAPDGLIGMIAFTAYAHPMSGELTVAEVFWWVEPERRGAGVRLLKRAEQWARNRGAAVLQMIAPTANVGAFYERLGFAPIETIYQRSLR
jgi:GNAT superfamily N-acetyltransferase